VLRRQTRGYYFPDEIFGRDFRTTILGRGTYGQRSSGLVSRLRAGWSYFIVTIIISLLYNVVVTVDKVTVSRGGVTLANDGQYCCRPTDSSSPEERFPRPKRAFYRTCLRPFARFPRAAPLNTRPAHILLARAGRPVAFCFRLSSSCTKYVFFSSFSVFRPCFRNIVALIFLTVPNVTSQIVFRLFARELITTACAYIRICIYLLCNNSKTEWFWEEDIMFRKEVRK